MKRNYILVSIMVVVLLLSSVSMSLAAKDQLVIVMCAKHDGI